jgi:predicted dehydrogenase
VRRFPATECFRLEIEQFNRAIDGKGEAMTPPEQGLRAIAVGEALYDAIKTARAARIADYLPRSA